jgi:plastocyanin
MTQRLSALLLAALLTLALAACANSASESTSEPTPTAEASQPAESEAPASEPAESEAAASEERVRIDGSNFDPEELTIAAGTEVQWVNADSFGHTVTEGTDGQAVDDPIVDEEIAQNGTVSVTFEEPGTYDITCRIHPSMNMTITVEG